MSNAKWAGPSWPLCTRPILSSPSLARACLSWGVEHSKSVTVPCAYKVYIERVLTPRFHPSALPQVGSMYGSKGIRRQRENLSPANSRCAFHGLRVLFVVASQKCRCPALLIYSTETFACVRKALTSARARRRAGTAPRGAWRNKTSIQRQPRRAMILSRARARHQQVQPKAYRRAQLP